MGIELDPYWIVGGGIGIALLGVIAWYYTQRDPAPGEEDAAPADAAQPSAPDATPANPAPEAPAFEAPVEADGAAPRQAGVERAPEPPEAGVEAAPEPTTEAPGAAAVEPAATTSEPPMEPELEQPEDGPVEADDDGEDAAPHAAPVRDAAFEAARARFEGELQAGHFSKLDVFDAWENTDWNAAGRKPPRSEYFHRVVAEALSARNAFEALLCEADRKKFVDVHSQYLDEVTRLDDPQAREEAHREQLRFVAALRPRIAGGGETDGA